MWWGGNTIEKTLSSLIFLKTEQTFRPRKKKHNIMSTESSTSRLNGTSIASSLGSFFTNLKPNASMRMMHANSKNEDNNTAHTDDMSQDSSCSQQEEEEYHHREASSSNGERRVCFNARVKRRFIISRDEYTQEEVEAAWWTKKEYVGFQRDCIKQVNKMETGIVFKDRKYCARGLETHTLLESKIKSKARHESMDAVLDEQDYLREEGVDIMEWIEPIAEAYYSVSASCQMWASTIGLRDQRAAEEDDEDVDDEIERMTKTPSLRVADLQQQSRPAFFTPSPCSGKALPSSSSSSSSTTTTLTGGTCNEQPRCECAVSA